MTVCVDVPWSKVLLRMDYSTRCGCLWVAAGKHSLCCLAAKWGGVVVLHTGGAQQLIHKADTAPCDACFLVASWGQICTVPLRALHHAAACMNAWCSLSGCGSCPSAAQHNHHLQSSRIVSLCACAAVQSICLLCHTPLPSLGLRSHQKRMLLLSVYSAQQVHALVVLW